LTGKRSPRAVAALARVLLHRLVDQVVDGALELARHLLERLPEDVAALKGARAFLVRIRAHWFLLSAIFGDTSGERIARGSNVPRLRTLTTARPPSAGRATRRITSSAPPAASTSTPARCRT
jgi:hypothetical protein